MQEIRKKSDCPFCQKNKQDYVLESLNFAVIYNISPILPGHCLIIPKSHCESLFELDEAGLAEFMILSRKLAELLMRVFDTKAFDWAIQEGEEAGQSQAHLHMHVVPRKIGDLSDPGAWYRAIQQRENDLDTFERFRLSEKELAEQTHLLRKEADAYFASDSFLL